MNRRIFLKTMGILLAGSMIPDYSAFAKQKSYDFSKFSDEEVLARMLFAEAGELYLVNEEEPIMIGLTAINRLNKFSGASLKEIILAPEQYSCFNRYNSRLQKMNNLRGEDLDAWKKSLDLSGKILSGDFYDLNQGQTHFHKKHMKKYPRWAKSPKMKKIPGEKFFKHYFYEEL